jgi:hypothetical protein
VNKLHFKLKAAIRSKSQGNVESTITILPQVAIFLISIQLVFMQFSQSKDAYLLHGQVNSSSSNPESDVEYREESLIGGGKLKVSTRLKNQPVFLSNLISIKAKTTSIELDESAIN